jgi:hypothetical protein
MQPDNPGFQGMSEVANIVEYVEHKEKIARELRNRNEHIE